MITVRTLGPAEVRIDGKPTPPELLWRKNLALLVYLARSPHRTRSREHLMALLWGDRPPSSARHSLREAIRAIRSACGDGALLAEADNLTLAAGAVELDVQQLEAACARGDWSTAARLDAGDFLDGFGVPDAGGFEDWLSAERRQVRALLVDALVRQADAEARAGRVADAAALARRALALEALSASATRALMNAQALAGERAEALATYDAYAQSHRDTLGSAPDDEVTRLAERIRRERAPRLVLMPLRGAESRRAPLVGRSRQLERLVELLRGARRRAAVLIIDGDSGSGRTRLAEELAARARLDGAHVVYARATPADRDTEWAGLFALARGGLLEAPVAGAPAEALAAFARRIEEWADRFPGARQATPLEPGAAFSAVCRAAAGEAPLVMIVDDAHWLDGASLAQLEALLRDCAHLPLCLVLTAARTPARLELDRLRERAGRDFGGGVEVLRPLAPDDLAELCRWAMPAWDNTARERLARRITADSAGLPLLAVELLHAVALGLDLENTHGAWPVANRTLDQTRPGELPETIVAAIRIGFRRLSANAQGVVAALAVLGGRAGQPALGRATGLDQRALVDALDEAEWQRWIVADARGYAFVAKITAEVVARDMVTKGQRLRIEQSVAPAGLEPA